MNLEYIRQRRFRNQFRRKKRYPPAEIDRHIKDPAEVQQSHSQLLTYISKPSLYSHCPSQEKQYQMLLVNVLL